MYLNFSINNIKYYLILDTYNIKKTRIKHNLKLIKLICHKKINKSLVENY